MPALDSEAETHQHRQRQAQPGSANRKLVCLLQSTEQKPERKQNQRKSGTIRQQAVTGKVGNESARSVGKIPAKNGEKASKSAAIAAAILPVSLRPAR